MAKSIMVLGTMSGSGKSTLVAGLCRLFRQDGHRVAPFKSQNMALNSYVTAQGLEMGRAQAMQAEAAGIPPSVHMNPILLKPTGEMGSQVIVNGEVRAHMSAVDYFAYKHTLIPDIRQAYDALAAEHDIIVLEGAGSPAEINLNQNDIVNLGMAAMVDAPALLVGDIDRGGVFASLYGTMALLPPSDRARIHGIIINKFRGDIEILRPGLALLEELVETPVMGVLPMLNLELDDEDSLAPRLTQTQIRRPIDVAVLRLPRISNFTDFYPLEQQPALGVRYVGSVRQLGQPDLLILPGSKSSMDDLRYLRQSGLEAAILRLAAAGVPVLGICGGYQMLGQSLADPEGVEGGGEMQGMGLLPIHTVFGRQKQRRRVEGSCRRVEGFFACLQGARFSGYEMHMGESQLEEDCPALTLHTSGGDLPGGAVCGHVMGCYVHGVFDSGEWGKQLAAALLAQKGLKTSWLEPAQDIAAHKERQYDALADALRQALDIQGIYKLLDHGA